MSSLLQSSYIPALHSANNAVSIVENRAHSRACVFDDRKRTVAKSEDRTLTAAAKPTTSDRKQADKTSAVA